MPALPALFTRMSSGATASVAASDRVVVGHVETAGHGPSRRRPSISSTTASRALEHQVVDEHLGAGRRQHRLRCRAPLLGRRRSPGRGAREVDRRTVMSCLTRVVASRLQIAPSSWNPAISSASKPGGGERVVGVRTGRAGGGSRSNRVRAAPVASKRTGVREHQPCPSRRRARRSPRAARAGRRAGRRGRFTGPTAAPRSARAARPIPPPDGSRRRRRAPRSTRLPSAGSPSASARSGRSSASHSAPHVRGSAAAEGDEPAVGGAVGAPVGATRPSRPCPPAATRPRASPSTQVAASTIARVDERAPPRAVALGCSAHEDARRRR